MIYPLHLVNIEQEGTREVLQASYDRAHSINGLPAMVQSHAGPIGAALGQGDTALEGLKRLQGNLYPNGLWFRNPCIESSLGMATIVQDMLLQSWSDPAADEPGPIRVFPALPSAWKDVEFRDLRTEGAFLVSAKRTGGETEWVRIKSLAGEPCRVRPSIEGAIRLEGERDHTSSSRSRRASTRSTSRRAKRSGSSRRRHEPPRPDRDHSGAAFPTAPGPGMPRDLPLVLRGARPGCFRGLRLLPGLLVGEELLLQ